MGAGILVVLLLFFNSLLADLPQSALAAVVITAALSLVNLRAVRRYARVRPSSVVLSLVASLGVIAFGVLQGIVIDSRDEQVRAYPGSMWHEVARAPTAR